MKPLRSILLLWLSFISLAAAEPQVTVKKIWDKAPHCAFTDLIHNKDAWWCVFRESAAHVGGDGKIRVLTSPDGETWESAALLAEEHIDLRDPKISIMPDGRLMLAMGGSDYRGGTKLLGRQPRVSFSKDGRTWSAPQRVLAENDWLWRVTWHDGTAWGTSYRTRAPEGTPEDKGEWSLTLVRSTDALDWKPVTTFKIEGRPNETTLRFQGDECLALVRREAGDKQGWFGRARPPYTEWGWKPIGRFIGGPEFTIMPDGALWAAGRDLRPAPDGPKTALGLITADGKWTPSLTLPSGGDTSYAGIVQHEGGIWMSYYSSHEGRSAIYLARIRGLP